MRSIIDNSIVEPWDCVNNRIATAILLYVSDSVGHNISVSVRSFIWRPINDPIKSIKDCVDDFSEDELGK